jgi:hypothetical protein
MDYQSCTKYCGKLFTDRGPGKWLVLSATTSSGEITEYVKTHIEHAGACLLMKDIMFIMCVPAHFKSGDKFK